jgi:hypothetical protein
MRSVVDGNVFIRSMTVLEQNTCDLHVPIAETEIYFKRDFANLEWSFEISGYRQGISVQEEFYVDCLTLEEATDMLFRNVSNQFPNDDV